MLTMLDDVSLWYSLSTTCTACKHVAMPTKQQTDQPVHFQLDYHSPDSIYCNTLFKVLFIFPAWYLFATVLTLIFILT